MAQIKYGSNNGKCETKEKIVAKEENGGFFKTCLPWILAQLFLEKTRGIAIAFVLCNRHHCSRVKTGTFCHISSITEHIYL